LAFDGNSIWVANSGDGSVTILQASNGIELGVLIGGGCCGAPAGLAFDGANIWVTDAISEGEVIKLRASDGAVLGSFLVGQVPRGIAFDGTKIWVANANGNSVSIL
jgi:DNA-binding beta-propeller fold protein YncE